MLYNLWRLSGAKWGLWISISFGDSEEFLCRLYLLVGCCDVWLGTVLAMMLRRF